MRENDLELYQSHNGTIKIAGETNPRRAGAYGFHCINEGKDVDFFCIGANANHVAMKAMGVCLDMIEQSTNGEVTIAFQPRRFFTVALENGKSLPRDCIAWRVIILDSRAQLKTPNEPNTRTN